MPSDPVPSDPVPSDPVPSDPVPSDPVPSDPVPSDPVPPLVLLDVDGVLNAVVRRPDPRTWPDWQSGSAVAGGRRWPITWSPSVVTAVLSWRERADVRWLTTWGHDANASLRELLGLPELPVAGTYADAVAPPPGQADPLPAAHAAVTPAAPDALTGRWWKFDVVRRLVRESPGRRVVWLDDDLAGKREVAHWMSAHTDALLVAPHPGTGLVADDLAAVADFLRR